MRANGITLKRVSRKLYGKNKVDKIRKQTEFREMLKPVNDDILAVNVRFHRTVRITEKIRNNQTKYRKRLQTIIIFKRSMIMCKNKNNN